jgi:hypothetical protein
LGGGTETNRAPTTGPENQEIKTLILSEARDLVIATVRDDAAKLSIPVAYDNALKKALAHYSQFRPRVLSQTVVCGASSQILTSAISDFDQGFLEQMRVEYPILTGPGYQTWLERDEWELQQIDAGQVIRFCSVQVGSSVRFVHRVKHVIPLDDALAMTVRESDSEAVCNWASAEALIMLANLFTQTVDKMPQADFANFSNKGADYQSRANALKRLFYDHLNAASRREGSSVTLVRG